VCELPKIKCGDCPNQAFVPVDDQAVMAHLRGRHVMGVYPLRKDETCWFLAVDFDKETWTDDVAAFVATCRDVGLRPSVERSRSGDGAHVWFFFSEPTPAAAARKMGCYLITETMSRRHELSFDSYDRLFPSQDTMPRGGFGNLIALPLQHGPRQNGNSVFLDDRLQPFPDDQQWAHLASVQRIDRRAVEAIAGQATRQGAVLGVRAVEAIDDEDSAPWARPPSGRPEHVPVPGPLPTLRRMLDGGRACFALFAAAEELGLGFVSGVPPYVYVQRIQSADLAAWKNLRPCSPGETPDLIVRQAPAAQSVFRGVVRPEGLAACDVLQIWVDVESHPSRGREQAALIRKRVLQRVIEGGDLGS
jgi:hypothetical protein